jgi:hypothetical protein
MQLKSPLKLRRLLRLRLKHRPWRNKRTDGN